MTPQQLNATPRSVQRVARPEEMHWVGDGFHVVNFIPAMPGFGMRDMDPFILMDYNPAREVAPSDVPGGVDVHPHRGFETVTITYSGKVEHHDSNGGGGVIGEGDVQWMTAARGVLHKEFHEREWAKQGGTFHMVQLWTNLPAQDKMGEPQYQTITKAEMPHFDLPQGGYIEVIAGEHAGVKGKASTHSPIHVMNAHMKAGETAEFSFPSSYNTALLVVKGAIAMDAQRFTADTLVKMANDGEQFSFTADEDATLLVLSGEPLNEPIAAYGPFVMNTREQILQAYDDFSKGKFGTLPAER